MVKEVKPLQPLKQFSSSTVTEEGMVIEVKLLHFLKQAEPKEVIEEGIVIEVKPLQPSYLLLVDYQYYTL